MKHIELLIKADGSRFAWLKGCSIMLVTVMLFISPLLASAATITIINRDGPGEGFNDPTPVSPVGGNPGTTLGEQRLNALQYAAGLWGSLIESSVPIEIGAYFENLGGSGTWARLGVGGTHSMFRDFAGAPRPATLYPSALANSLAGSDNDPGVEDLDVLFNSDVDNPTVLGTRSYYYGYDGNAGTDFDLVGTALHEIGHGLGFTTFISVGTGAKFTPDNIHYYDDAYMLYLENHATGKLFPDMTDAERLEAGISTGNLQWAGPNVTAYGWNYSDGFDSSSGHVKMYAPTPYVDGASLSHFDTTLSPNDIMEPHHNNVAVMDLSLQLLKDLGWQLIPPPATTVSATGITEAEATLNGFVIPQNLNTSVSFQYGTTTSYGLSEIAAESPLNGTAPATASKAITGLAAGTLYHYRVVASNAAGLTYGNDMTFTTPGVATIPSATTNAATAVDYTMAMLNGTVNANNGWATVTFQYGLNISYGSTVSATPGTVTGNSATAVSASIMGLTPGLTYHFRVVASSAGGTTYGIDQTFTTTAAPACIEFISDGGFEGGTPNIYWVESSTNYGTPLCNAAVCSYPARTGNWYAWFGGALSQEDASLSKFQTILAGNRVALTFYLWMPEWSGNGSDYLNVKVDGNQVFSVLESSTTYRSGYLPVRVDLSTYADGTMHQIVFEASTSGAPVASSFLLDDVSINCSTVRGDVNGDGMGNIVDALFVARFSAGLGVTPFYIEAADVNCDTTLNIVDALLIARKAAGLAVPGWCM